MWSIEGRERCFCHSKGGEWGGGGGGPDVACRL